jgi:hypothetical protein
MTDILITATPKDLRQARICLASVRRFEPQATVRFLPGAPLPESFLREVKEHFDAGVVSIEAGEYGWGLVKLEPLCGSESHRFLVLDADTVLLGPVTPLFEGSNAPFLVDDEQQTVSDTKRLYYDAEEVRRVDRDARSPAFVFNSGQWFGTAGVLTRGDFDPWVEWSLPRQLRHPEIFMPGDQGIFNYVLNQKHQLEGLAVERRKIMRWPGHGLDDVRLDDLKVNPRPQIIHWAGYKAPRLESLPRADLLLHFERLYYEKIPDGERLRKVRARNTAIAYHYRNAMTRLGQRLRRLWGGE